MFEFAIRVVLSLLLVACSFIAKGPAIELASRIGAFSVVLAGITLVVTARGLRAPRVSALLVAMDCMLAAFALGASSQLSTLGFLCAIPALWAIRHWGVSTLYATATAAMSVPVAAVTLGLVQPVGWLLQATGVFLIGFASGQREPLSAVPAADTLDQVAPTPETKGNEDLEIRAAFRDLKDHLRQVEARASVERCIYEINELRTPGRERLPKRLCDKLLQITGVQGLSFYALAQYGPRLVVRENTSDELPSTAIEIDIRSSVKAIVGQAEKALTTEVGGHVATVPLVGRGKIVGLVVLKDDDREHLDKGRALCESLAPSIASLIEEAERTSDVERRLRETELLYEVAATAQGSASANSLAERTAQALFEMLEVDHVGVSWVDGNDALHATVQGQPLRLLDAMSFAGGGGLLGWLRTGAPELLIYQTSEDARCPSDETVRRRIGSFFALPIRFGETIIGLLTLATHRTGGLDLRDAETCRTVCDELAQAVARLRGINNLGLVNPSELARLILGGSGVLTFIEPLHVGELRQKFGAIAYARVEREFARRVRTRLPEGGALCRRKSGALVAYLPAGFVNADEWAQDIGTLASMVNLMTPDGSRRIPFAVRTRVAQIGTQSNQFSDEIAA